MRISRVATIAGAFAFIALVMFGCATDDPYLNVAGRVLCTGGVVAIGVLSVNPFASAGLDLCYPR